MPLVITPTVVHAFALQEVDDGVAYFVERYGVGRVHDTPGGGGSIPLETSCPWFAALTPSVRRDSSSDVGVCVETGRSCTLRENTGRFRGFQGYLDGIHRVLVGVTPRNGSGTDASPDVAKTTIVEYLLGWDICIRRVCFVGSVQISSEQG